MNRRTRHGLRCVLLRVLPLYLLLHTSIAGAFAPAVSLHGLYPITLSPAIFSMCDFYDVASVPRSVGNASLSPAASLRTPLRDLRNDDRFPLQWRPLTDVRDVSVSAVEITFKPTCPPQDVHGNASLAHEIIPMEPHPYRASTYVATVATDPPRSGVPITTQNPLTHYVDPTGNRLPLSPQIGHLMPTSFDADGYRSYVDEAGYVGFIRWIDRALTFQPLTSHVAEITFVPKNGYTLEGVDLASVSIPTASRIEKIPEHPSRLRVTFKETAATKTFRIYTDLPSRNTRLAHATLIYQNAVFDVWAEDGARFLPAQQSTLERYFVRDVVTMIENMFGELPDVDRNEKVTIFIGKLPIGGYVDYQDSRKSNFYLAKDSTVYGETIYLDHGFFDPLNQTGTASALRPAWDRLISHELQHIANREVSDVWLNEGLSLMASYAYEQMTKNTDATCTTHLACATTPAMRDSENTNQVDISIQRFLRAPDRYTRDVLDFRGDALSYAKSHLFLQYIRTQIEAIHGKGTISLYRELIVADEEQSSEKAITQLITRYVDPKMTFSQCVEDFSLALQRMDDTGKYGFQGEALFAPLKRYVATQSHAAH